MTIIKTVVLRGLVLFLGLWLERSLGQDPCSTYTLVRVPGASPSNPSTVSSASLSDCQSSCVNQATCSGYTWLSNTCYRSLDSSINYNASTDSTYYSLIRDLSNCNQTQTCSYSWYGLKDIHAFGGSNNNKSNLNDCIKSCQTDDSCLALDWDTAFSSCWIINTPGFAIGNATRVYHFDKNCQTITTLPTTTTTVATTTKTTTPTTTPTTVRPSSTLTTTTLPVTPPTVATASTTRTALGSSGSSTASSSSTSSATSASSASSASSSSSTSSASSSTTASTTTTAAPLCNGVRCGLGEECVGNKTISNLSCVCGAVGRCNQPYQPVCGSDNVTYSNDCELQRASCHANGTIRFVRGGNCDNSGHDLYQPGDNNGGDFANYPQAIKPAYIVLAGLGGGCLLLVLTAVIILCQYPMHGAETYSSSGTLVNGRGYPNQDIKMDTTTTAIDYEGGGGGGEENVEFNPYYNRSELGAPDFTKEENIM